MTRVLVCGGRDLQFALWYRRIEKVLDAIGGITAIIQGGANGADDMAGMYARAHGIPCEMFAADWKLNSKAAGPIRNQRMIDEGKPDLVVAFPGKKGTADMVRRAVAAGVNVMEIHIPDNQEAGIGSNKEGSAG